MLSLGLIKPGLLKTLIPQTLGPSSRRYWDDAASEPPPRLLVVQPRVRSDALLQSKLSEALALADSLEEQRDGCSPTDQSEKASPPYVVVQNPILRSARARADTYFGPGTVDTIKCHIYGSESKDEVDAVFVNAILSGIQQRNLEREWEKPVLDRVGLIIEIFNAHAHTREAKLQAELAALTYKKSRLVRVRGSDGRFTFGQAGEAEVVSARGRGSGGRGFISGAGETELQLQRRRILERRNTLLTQIEEVRRTRAVQRAARRRQGGLGDRGLPTVAIVGYTNAGKSTLVNALTDGDLYSDSRLFATLDPRLKSVLLPSGRKVLLSDTVGFISDLPVQLVEAFHATLEEVVEADLLVHVVDCTAPNIDNHRLSVLQVLQQIGVSNEKLQHMIEVWNKIDCEHVSPEEQACDVDDDDSSSLCETEGDDELDMEVQGGADNMKASGESEWEDMIDDEVDYADSQSPGVDYKKLAAETLPGTLNGTPGETSNYLAQDKDVLYQAPSSPHVRISAKTGVGLQELLEVLDERLKYQDDKLDAHSIVDRSFFDRKWRPPRPEDRDAAVEL